MSETDGGRLRTPAKSGGRDEPAASGAVRTSEDPERHATEHSGPQTGRSAGPTAPVLLSGPTTETVRAHARALADYLADHPETSVADVAHTLAAERPVLSHRAAVVAADTRQLRERLEALAAGRPDPMVTEAAAVPGKLAVLFPGQGSQCHGMGRQLYERFGVFADAFDAACAHLDPHLDAPLRATLFDEHESAPPWSGHTMLTQAALFAVEVALYRLLEHGGAAPDFLLGHSIGELAAVHVAGVLSLADAAEHVAHRGRLIHSLAAGGAMVALQASETEVCALLAGHQDRAALAAVNGRLATVVSGDRRVLTRIAETMRERGRKATWLPVSHAFHSPRVEPILDQFAQVVAGLTYHTPAIPVVSALTGRPLTDTEARSPQYWVRHVRHTVRFADGIRWLRGQGVATFLEAGPGGGLSALGNTELDDPACAFLPALRRERPEDRCVATALANLHVHRAPVDTRAAAGAGHRVVDLPPRPAGGDRDETAPQPVTPRRRLAGLPPAARLRELTRIVGDAVAGVLDHDTPADPRLPFRDLGFDSVAAVELRARLTAATGLDLPATLAFDHPTPQAVTGRLAAAFEDAEDPSAARPHRNTDDEPVAIVAMSCRLPGGITTPEALWQALDDGRDLISAFPATRGWNTGRLYDPDPDTPDRTYCREGGFLDDISGFDPAFFGISPREALAMDPQQRLVLETCWETLERAGLDPAALRGSRTGVFAGSNGQDYGTVLHTSRENVEEYQGTGLAASVLSGRVAYTLGLEGPAVTIDTACSSSLVALHLATNALHRDECDLALVTGSTVMNTPRKFIQYSRQRVLAPDGRAKAFAASADGTGWAEGVTAVLVERLCDARRNGHPVLAVIRGSAVNQDGASNGLTAPSGPAQQRVIRQALADAGLSAEEVDAVEAHGTGTRLGDPIEAGALQAVYGRDRTGDRPLWLGSLKSNTGHTQAAAGLAGVIKMVLAMRHETLPRTLHIDAPSPHVDWSPALRLLTHPVPWPAGDRPRRAGVSSFGVSGTNAHVLLEEPPATPLTATPGQPHPPTFVPWVLSARTPAALRATAARLRDRIAADRALHPRDVGFTLHTARSRFEHRAVVIGRDRESFLTGLDAVAAHAPQDGEAVCGSAAAGPREPVFLFPGQGSQWPGMGRELAYGSDLFARRLRDCADAFAPYVDWSLEEVLTAGPDGHDQHRLTRPDVVQPALFAMMVSLAHTWRGHGVRPAAVIGHSQGEIAAAHIAGALTLDEAARIVALRSQALCGLSDKGGMMSVALPVDRIRTQLHDYDGRLSIAAVNSPASVVVAGDNQALKRLHEDVMAAGVRVRTLPVDVPGHSPQVERLRGELLKQLGQITRRSADIPFYSTVTGGLLDTALLDAEYWYRNLREPVRFEQTVRAALSLGAITFIEASPHPVLTVPLQETLEAARAANVPIVATVRRDDAGPRRLLTSFAEAHVTGVEVDWSGQLHGGHRVELPTYPFQRRPYWPVTDEAEERTDLAGAGLTSAAHPLLGAAVGIAATGETVYTGRLSRRTHPWLADHAVMGEVLLPGTALVEMVMHAGRAAGCPQLVELALEAPVVLGQDGGVMLQLVIGAEDAGHRTANVYTRPADGPDHDRTPGGDGWRRHATGLLTAAETHGGPPTPWPPEDAAQRERPEQPERLDVEGFYGHLAHLGYEYGPAFRGLRAGWRLDGETFAEIRLPEEQRAAAPSFGLHPALLDAALHAAKLGGFHTGDLPTGTRLPFAWRGVTVHRTGATELRVRIASDGGDGIRLTLADGTGAPVADIESMVSRPVSSAQLAAARTGYHDALFRPGWTPVPSRPAGAGPLQPATVAVLGDRDLALAAAVPPAGWRLGHHLDLASLGRAVDAGAPVPDAVLLPCPVAADPTRPGTAAAVHRATGQVLRLLQDWLAEERWASSRLVLLTRGATAPRKGEAPTDLAHAALWGLVRSAQSEHPGRFALLDVAEDADTLNALPRLTDTTEPQLAARGGELYAPRLTRVPVGEPSTPPALDPDGTVLVTGAAGTLGRLVTTHLVRRHGVRRLLLASRQGDAAPGAAALRAQLAGLGAETQMAACDLADREAVAALLGRVPPRHRLTAVIHAAGVLDDSVITSLTASRLSAVLRPKVDAAVNLHDLTADQDLAAFVLFSSAAATFGNAGQANYAAANAFLDALAEHRRAQGLTAASLAWGLWQPPSGMADLSDTDVRRMARRGDPLSAARGLELFDIALGIDAPVLVPVSLNPPRPRAGRPPTDVHPLLRELVAPVPPGPARPQPADDAAGPPLAARLAHLPQTERERAVLDLVLEHTARVLGHASPQEVDPQAAFLSLGFDSLTSLELRTRLGNAAGLRLPATVVFEHPAPAVLAAHLLSQLAVGPAPQPPAPQPTAPTAPADRADDRAPTAADIDRLTAAMAGAAPGELAGIGASLGRLMAAWTSRTSGTP